MEDCSGERKRKRAREEDDDSVDPEVDSPGLKMKITRLESGSAAEEEIDDRVDSEEDVDSFGCQLTRLDSDGSCVNSNDSYQPPSELFNSPEVKRIQDDLLNLLDETDTVPDRDLDSVMRSFQEEILVPGSYPVGPEAMTHLGETQPDLDYLLEASDDELGLPPTEKSGEEKTVEEEGIDSLQEEVTEAPGFTGLMGFEDEILSHDSFELGLGSEFVTYDGMFEYPEPVDGLWRYESLQAQ